MAYSCRILADSLSPVGARLTTMEVCFPRMVLAEFNTHRILSRNSASSRAIPVEKQIRKIELDPFIPTYWGKNQKGMTAEEELSPDDILKAETEWHFARTFAIAYARNLLTIGVHKQITNRLLEPFMWHTVIVSATEWENFFNLRCHPDAQPEIRVIAEMMRKEYRNSEPIEVEYGQWHLPLVTREEMARDEFDWVKVSAGRCARVSYLTHDGRRAPEEDVALCDRLCGSGHMSPLEHPATPTDDANHGFVGNFRGWTQYRKTIPGEAVFHAASS